MEIHLVEKTEKTIKISFKEPDSTLIMPILDELDKNKDEDCRYAIPTPSS